MWKESVHKGLFGKTTWIMNANQGKWNKTDIKTVKNACN